jgi:hypothetical protein
LGVFNFLFYLDSYFVQYPIQDSLAWQYGYEDAVPYIESIKDEYDEVVVTINPPLDQSYMFFLFYTQYDPQKYLNEGGTRSGGFAEENAFGKYVFKDFDWEAEDRSGKLYVGRPVDFPGVPVLQMFEYLDGSPAIVVVEGK